MIYARSAQNRGTSEPWVSTLKTNRTNLRHQVSHRTWPSDSDRPWCFLSPRPFHDNDLVFKVSLAWVLQVVKGSIRPIPSEVQADQHPAWEEASSVCSSDWKSVYEHTSRYKMVLIAKGIDTRLNITTEGAPGANRPETTARRERFGRRELQ